ncbi:NAD(P)/FAD-dependent oxidoreductase [Paenibacillus sp. GCM10027627]|uniref:NAD(P)/FAD-dependent oxidoreductase n=1 Tax=unclassified Paenibacillus TaxID=185978 RepID=UPI00363D4EC4
MARMHDVIVLGAGVAGSATAKLLAEKGWDTLLVDRHRFPKHKVCGEFLSPESQDTLSRIGLLEEIKPLSPSLIANAAIYMRGGNAIRFTLPAPGFGLSRYRLDSSLHHAALSAGAQLRQGETAVALERDEQGYIVYLRNGQQVEQLRARLVISACGGTGGPSLGTSGSLMTDGGLQREGQASFRPPFLSQSRYSGNKTQRRDSVAQGLVGVKMHFEYAGKRESDFDTKGDDVDPESTLARYKRNGAESAAIEGIVELYFFRGGYAGLNAIEDGRVNVAALLDKRELPKGGQSVIAMLEEAANRHPRLKERLDSMKPLHETAAAVSPVRISPNPVPWKSGPLVGDAICRIPPLCGDGMSMALRSSELCAMYADRLLKGDCTIADLERGYSAAISAEFAGPLKWGVFAQSLLSSPLLASVLPGLARLAPGAVVGMFQATRLRAIK